MKVFTVHLSSQDGSPYQSGKHVCSDTVSGESPDAREKRTWSERASYDLATRKMFIPGIAFKKALETAASFLNMKIQGQRNATWKKHFLAGVQVFESLSLPVTVEDVAGSWVYVPSDGKRGGGTRVMRCFPTVPQWEGDVKFTILDDLITEEIFLTHLQAAGNFTGVGVFRPEKGGSHGRFKIVSCTKTYDDNPLAK